MRYVLMFCWIIILNILSCRQYDEDDFYDVGEDLSDAPLFETIIEKPEANVPQVPTYNIKFIDKNTNIRAENNEELTKKVTPEEKKEEDLRDLPPIPPSPIPLPPPEPIDEFLRGYEDFNRPLIGPGCGNGIRTGAEECDDGNDDNLDGCNNFCGLPFCGNFILDRGEECDDGGYENGDGCSERCYFERCGNFFLDPGEECDDGDGCSKICLFECDDGTTISKTPKGD